MKVPYPKQFHIRAIPHYLLTQDGEPLNGRSRNGKEMAFARLIQRKPKDEHMTDGLSVHRYDLYVVHNGTGTPVGPAMDRPYAFLAKANITFPKKLYNNLFVNFHEAEEACRELSHYYQRMRDAKMRKNERVSVSHCLGDAVFDQESQYHEGKKEEYRQQNYPELKEFLSHGRL